MTAVLPISPDTHPDTVSHSFDSPIFCAIVCKPLNVLTQPETVSHPCRKSSTRASVDVPGEKMSFRYCSKPLFLYLPAPTLPALPPAPSAGPKFTPTSTSKGCPTNSSQSDENFSSSPTLPGVPSSQAFFHAAFQSSVASVLSSSASVSLSVSFFSRLSFFLSRIVGFSRSISSAPVLPWNQDSV